MGEVSGVQEIVLPTKSRNKATGYRRNVKEIAPWTNFTARINGGELISEKTAKAGFAKALACFDLAKIAEFGVMMNGEPLLAKGKSAFKKYPQSVAHVKDGWHVNTYCSTAKKVSLLGEFAKLFGAKIELNVIPHKLPHQPKVFRLQTGTRVLPKTAGNRHVAGVPYPVGVVVQALFPEVFKRHLVTVQEVAELQKDESSSRFKTGGNPVLKLNRGQDNDRYKRTSSGKVYARYYADAKVRIEFQGVKYYLTSQFAPEAIGPVVGWLEAKGLTKKDICQIVEQCKESRLGTDLFVSGNKGKE